MFEQDISNAKPPKLFFQDPLELLYIFKSIEEQNKNSLTYLESLASQLDSLGKTLKQVDETTQKEVDAIQNVIDDLEVIKYLYNFILN